MRWWNMTYPVDRWWRTKYKVSFNSERHRSMNFVDMKIEFEEELFYLTAKREEKSPYLPGGGDWLKKQRVKKMTTREVDDAFDSFDPSSMELTEDGQIKI
jgi:hypothetical protein